MRNKPLDIETAIERVFRIRRIAERRAHAEGTRRALTKARAHFRGEDLSHLVGRYATVADTVGVCSGCARSTRPHLHVFGSCVPVVHFREGMSLALHVEHSHTFRKAGSPVGFDKTRKPHDFKARSAERNREAIRTVHKAVHKRLKARKLLDSPSARTRKRAAETLGLVPRSIPQASGVVKGYGEIWKTALVLRRMARPVTPK